MAGRNCAVEKRRAPAANAVGPGEFSEESGSAAGVDRYRAVVNHIIEENVGLNAGEFDRAGRGVVDGSCNIARAGRDRAAVGDAGVGGEIAVSLDGSASLVGQRAVNSTAPAG